jgi:hypothetical protein
MTAPGLRLEVWCRFSGQRSEVADPAVLLRPAGAIAQWQGAGVDVAVLIGYVHHVLLSKGPLQTHQPAPTATRRQHQTFGRRTWRTVPGQPALRYS